jgi:hypothetical protein
MDNVTVEAQGSICSPAEAYWQDKFGGYAEMLRWWDDNGMRYEVVESTVY